jgi:hypothetical protein
LETSIFFLKFYGYFFFLFAGALLISKKGMKVMIAASKHETHIMFTGMLNLIIGLPVIILHNIWTFDVLGFVTFIGWNSVVKGVVRIAFPSFVVKKMESNNSESKVWLIIAVLIGAGLMYCGYYPYWC